MGLMDHVDQIAKIAEVAGKEFAIEQALEKMEKDWTPVNLEVIRFSVNTNANKSYLSI